MTHYTFKLAEHELVTIGEAIEKLPSEIAEKLRSIFEHPATVTAAEPDSASGSGGLPASPSGGTLPGSEPQTAVSGN